MKILCVLLIMCFYASTGIAQRLNDPITIDSDFDSYSIFDGVGKYVKKMKRGIKEDLYNKKKNGQIKSLGMCYLSVGSGSIYVATFCAGGSPYAIVACGAISGAFGIAIWNELFEGGKIQII